MVCIQKSARETLVLIKKRPRRDTIGVGEDEVSAMRHKPSVMWVKLKVTMNHGHDSA